MLKFLIFTLGIGGTGVGFAADRDTQILKCRAQRDSQVVAIAAYPTPEVGLAASEGEVVIIEPTNTQDSNDTPVILTNPTLEQRALLGETPIPIQQNHTFSAFSSAQNEENDNAAPEYAALYQYKLVDGPLRPQLESLMLMIFPDFSVSWDKYQTPYRWYGGFELENHDRWTLLNSIVESYGITVTVSGNFVVEFIAMESE